MEGIEISCITTKQNMKTYTSLLVLGVLATNSIYAQETTESKAQNPEPKQTKVESTPKTTSENTAKSPIDSAISETTFITASRSERPVETIAGNVTIITSEDIKNSTARTLTDVLKNQVGIDVRQNFGTAQTARIDIRGFGESAAANTLILIDGRKNTRSDLASPDLSTIPIARIERIEIYRGGRSVLYGDNATGGVINVITKRGSSEKNILTLKSEIGSDHTYNFGAVLDGSTENLRYSLDASHSESDGYHQNNHTRTKSAGFSVTSTEFENWDISLAGGSSESDLGIFGGRAPDGDRRSANDLQTHLEGKEQYISLNPKYWITKDVSLELQTSYREGESEIVYPAFNYEGDVRINDFQIGPKATFHHQFDEVNNTFIAGYDFTTSRSNQFNTFADPTVRHRRTNAVYIFNSAALQNDTVFIDTGYRREHVAYSSDSSSNDYSSRDLDAFTLGFTVNYSENSKVFISADRSFRSQRVDEGGGATFDQELDPQITQTLQAGIVHQFNDKLTLNATIFQIYTDDEIFFDPTLPSGFNGQNTTYEKTKRRGIELETKYRARQDLELFANYTHLNAELGEDDASNSVNDGNDIPNVPQDTMNAGLSWDINPAWNFNFVGKWTDSYHNYGDYSNTGEKNDGYIVFDAKASYNWKWLTIYGGCNNLFDHTYDENVTVSAFGDTVYTAPGRTFFGGVEVQYEF